MAKPYQQAGCSARCWTAKNKRCRCKCHGRFHGSGNPNHGKGLTENKKLDQYTMPEFKTYQEKLDWCSQNGVCPDCGLPIDQPVMMCSRWHGYIVVKEIKGEAP